MKSLVLNFQRLGDIVDATLDKLTTYRLVLYLLCLYIMAAFTFSLSGHVHFSFSAWQILASAVWLVAVSRLANWFFSTLFKIPHNHESDLITGLILTLILTPAMAAGDYVNLAAAAAVAMLSKYVLTFRGRHIFNPAAFGAFIAGRLLHDYASWWIGFRQMWPILLIGGLLILRKMRRFQMAGTFAFVYLVYLLATINTENIFHSIYLGLLATPLIFLATVMLTEPLTSPTKFRDCLVYSVLVGIFYAIVKLHVTPEEALLAGNLLTFAIEPNRSLIMQFVRQEKEADGIYNYYFHGAKKLAFQAGQYLELTLPGVQFDGRGNRRYLTIASSPSEDNLMFSVRIPAKPSSFKTTLKKLGHGDKILASQLAGSFVLPADTQQKLTLIAGGIGVTPFRSMAKQLTDSGQKRDVNLLYFASRPEEFAFAKTFSQAESVGLKVKYIASQTSPGWRGLTGTVGPEPLKQLVPDFQSRHFYISGPQGFVAAARKSLLMLGVDHNHIKTDFFPGYN